MFSSDTESVDVRTKETRRNIPPIKLTSLFKKNKDKVAYESEPEKRVIEAEETPKPGETEAEEAEKQQKVPEEKAGLVYAELDLVRADLKPVLKSEDEKTEYAEIVYKPAESKESEESPKK